MPNTSSAKKELRKANKRKEVNYRLKTHVKSLAKQLSVAIKEEKMGEASDINKKLQQAASKSSKSNIFHKNKAKRIISKAAKAVINK